MLGPYRHGLRFLVGRFSDSLQDCRRTTGNTKCIEVAKSRFKAIIDINASRLKLLHYWTCWLSCQDNYWRISSPKEVSGLD
ncbi:uncharacterized protein METZ01_LOCUS222024 [marine metagenome]|uniref:Uncharacterized protein n=1 Tax=marine metagenome TaxID=408172 RepID=A0A382G1R6_9ZZZZ